MKNFHGKNSIDPIKAHVKLTLATRKNSEIPRNMKIERKLIKNFKFFGIYVVNDFSGHQNSIYSDKNLPRFSKFNTKSSRTAEKYQKFTRTP